MKRRRRKRTGRRLVLTKTSLFLWHPAIFLSFGSFMSFLFSFGQTLSMDSDSSWNYHGFGCKYSTPPSLSYCSHCTSGFLYVSFILTSYEMQVDPLEDKRMRRCHEAFHSRPSHSIPFSLFICLPFSVSCLVSLSLPLTLFLLLKSFDSSISPLLSKEGRNWWEDGEVLSS